MPLARLWLALPPLALLLIVALVAPSPGAAQGVPGISANKCVAGKNKCVAKRVMGLLKCREACQKKPGQCGAAQAECEQKVRDKFDGGANPEKGCFAKLEAKENPDKPKSVCANVSDASEIAARADTFVADLLDDLEAFCGDGLRNGEEACEGADVGGETCLGLGLPNGPLACTTSCELDTTGCNENSPGLLFIFGGVPAVGYTILGQLGDPDQISTPVVFTWQQSLGGFTWTDIATETVTPVGGSLPASELLLGPAQVDHLVRVRADYTDDRGFVESVLSLTPIGPVTATP